MRTFSKFGVEPIPRTLLNEWRLGAVTGFVAVAAGWVALLTALGEGQAGRWAAGASVALLYLLWELRRNLGENARPGEPKVLPTLGAGTLLTLLRGLFCALLAGFALIPAQQGWLAWAPMALYLAAAVADFFDGYAARVHNHATRLGASLDVAFDAFGALVAVSVLVHLGQLPRWFLVVGLIYYVFHAHMKLRGRSGRPVIPLRPNPYRRMYAGFLFGYFAVALIPLFESAWVTTGGYLFVTPVLAGFLVDWLFTTGAVRPENDSWVRFHDISRHFLYSRMPAVLRAAVLLGGGWWLAAGLGVQDGWTSRMAALGWPEPMLLATLPAVAGLAALGMTTVGWLGRLAALALVSLACLDAMLRGAPAPADYALVIPSIGVLLLGTGTGALWRPEDRMLLTQAGRPSARPERAAA